MKTLSGAGSRLTPEIAEDGVGMIVLHARMTLPQGLGREQDFGSDGRGFESLRARHFR
jgi:hypothetical protein